MTRKCAAKRSTINWMKSPVVRKSSAGFSIFELLIVVLMAGVILGYAIMRLRSNQVAIVRINAAQEFVTYLEQARFDSNRRQTTNVDQMACVTVVDNHTYSSMIASI